MRRNDMDFETWVEENNFTEDDLKLIKRTARNRAILWWLLPGVVTGIASVVSKDSAAALGSMLSGICLPLCMLAWTYYKFIKQRTFEPRTGIIYGICSLCMFVSFLMIYPAIIWFVSKKKFYGTGINGLLKKGLIGNG